MNILRRTLFLLSFISVMPVVFGQTAEDKDEIGRRYDYAYLEAIDSKLNEEYSKSFGLLSHCIAMCPERSEAYYDRALLYSMIGKKEEALKDFKKAYSINKSEKLYQQSMFFQSLFTGDYATAASIGEELVEKSPNIQTLNILVSIYDMQKDYDAMLRTLDRIEEVNGTDDEVTLAKMQIYERRGEKNRAYEELKRLVDKNPRVTSYKVMLGNWLFQNNQPEKAEKAYLEVLEAKPGDEAASMSLFDYYRETGLVGKADSLAKSMLMGTEVQPEAKVSLMGYIINSTEKEKADKKKILSLFDEVLASPGECAEMYEMKSAYMVVNKMPQEQLIETFVQVLSKYPDRLSVRLQLLQEYWNNKDYDNVIKYARPSEEYKDEDISVYYFLGLAYLMKDDNERALAALSEGTRYINEESNKMLVSDVFGIIGDLYHAKGLSAEAYENYDKSLQYNADNAECLNNYAYFLSLEGKDLDKSEKMSLKAIIAEPKNNTYLDTYAWILFLQGRYSDAKVYMEQLLANGTDEEEPGPVVYEHIGDIYAMNGEVEKAVEFWKKARVEGVKNKKLEKKIKKRMYIPEKKKK